MPSDLRTELINIVTPELAPYRGPILFDRGGTLLNDENIFANAGFSLVDTGKRKLLVTCAHVWSGLLEEREKDERVRMLLCLDFGAASRF